MLKWLLTVSLCNATSASEGREGCLVARGEQWVMREETRFGAGHSDPVGTSLQLTDCDRMTFKSSITECWRKTWPSGCLVAVAAAASHAIMEVCFAPKWKDTSRQMSLCRLILTLPSALGAEWKLTFSKMLSLHGARQCWDSACEAVFVMNEIILIFSITEGMTWACKKWSTELALWRPN